MDVRRFLALTAEEDKAVALYPQNDRIRRVYRALRDDRRGKTPDRPQGSVVRYCDVMLAALLRG
jgi:hypothetical protein